jgi:hypothetical protein
MGPLMGAFDDLPFSFFCLPPAYHVCSFVSVFDSGLSCLSVLHHSERIELSYNSDHSSQPRRPYFFLAHLAHSVSSLDHG